jgi:TetR/AcrR family transcriptional regulator, transcriptional repressor for nem operon
MTNSHRTQHGDKRARLVASASGLLHRNGVARTTLADIAKDADVPLGNVYYYFKTKDELIQAVIDAHAEHIRAALDVFEQQPTPHARLAAFARSLAGTGEYAARSGCPHGTLCSELDKRDDGMDRAAATLMSLYTDWAEEQFRQIGRNDARDLATTLIAMSQGASLLANTFRDPDLMRRQAHQIERWIDTLA